MKKFLICFVLVFSQMFGGAFAADELSFGGLNPELTAYISSIGDSETEFVPPLVSVPSPAALEAAELPEKYDARDENRIFYSGVGQAGDNTCWTFSSCLAAETAVKDCLGSFADLSEQHLKYAESSENDNPYGYERTVNSGGNFQMFEAYGGAWRGLVKEEDDPYVYGGEARDYFSVTAQKTVSFHLRGTVNIPNVASSVSEVSAEQRAEHVAEVKKYILRYGCCFSSMYWNSKYNNYSEKAYFNKSDASASNHAIAIIGWDDNYSKENFNDTPENDGAFIVKNSQSDTGYYMYMSYEDMYAGWYSSCVTDIAEKYDFGEIYNYNYFQPGAAFTLGAGKYNTSVNFESKYDGERITAVGAYTVSRNLGYEVYLSKTAAGNEMTDDDYVLAASGTFEMPGLHTVELSEPFELGDAGTSYTVRIKYISDSDFEIPVEKNVYTGAVHIYNVKSESGRGYLNTQDVDKYAANLYVKAFTDADFTVSLPFAGDEAFKNAKFSINGSAFEPLEKAVTAGLNDELTIDFADAGADIGEVTYGGEKYVLDDNKIKINVTKSGEVMPLAKPSAALSGVQCVKYDNYVEFSGSADFANPQKVIMALYGGAKLVGIKIIDADSSFGDFSENVSFNENADMAKLFVWDDFTGLSTGFGVIKFDI